MLRSLTDNPIERFADDRFGFQQYVEEINEVVLNATSLPITVGVFGEWGSGKSSFLKMWKDLLAQSPVAQTLWFNPWKYDQKLDVWAALIQSLLSEMQVAKDETVRARARKLARTATWLILRGAASFGGAIWPGSEQLAAALDRTVSDLAESDLDYYRDVNRFEHDFSEAVAGFVGTGGRLVVFIDDLDRCTPTAAMNVLEALKLFIGDARCVFVIAMDYDLLSAVAGLKFGKDLPIRGSAYLEKIVQLPFFLPDIGFESLRDSLHGEAGDVASTDAFWELVRVGLGANPRRIKRFLNVLGLAVAIAGRDRMGNRAGVETSRQLQLAKLLILRAEHREFFGELLRDLDLWLKLEASAALPPVGSHGVVQPERERDPILSMFLADRRLLELILLRPGTEMGFPPAPAGHDVAEMLRTVVMVEGREVSTGKGASSINRQDDTGSGVS